MSILGTVGAAVKLGLGLHHLQIAGEYIYSYLPSLSGTRSICQAPRTFTTIMKEIKTIGTHDGTFHCDEVLGCAMLRILFPDAQIRRSRKNEVLDACDIVIDVGGVYDLTTYRFDHHQKGFEVTAGSLLPGKPWNVKLSSAGLVFCHFGKDIIRCIVDLPDEKNLDRVFDQVYANFIQEVDGIDNGVPMCCPTTTYSISTNLSSRVSHLNKSWNQKEFDEEKAFNQAMQLTSEEFIDRVKYYSESWLPALCIVQSAIDNRFTVDPSGEIIELSQFCPWKAHYFKLEEELKLSPTVKFVVFFGEDGSWRVQSVSLDEKSFILRIPLHKAWQGLRGKDIGVEGAIFVHGTGFIGGNETREGAISMARKSLSSHVAQS
ncbi:chromosome 12 open reading frame 10 [Nesidiocoris tenuis]|uniref:Chromosome 12 open reading frame 10 n=1 Tax=Nesidiocoris tenuis TaxID=355587 RepID=A0ABN7ASB7_9HEMI|nr:chromosome 12 open reading frame 10 [Nesidiocoris tenuis]